MAFAPATLLRAARWCEGAVAAVAALGLLFHVFGYVHVGHAPGARYSTGDVIEFALLLLLFLLACLCSACGVGIALARQGSDLTPAYRALVIGMTTFVAYYLLLPTLPHLG